MLINRYLLQRLRSNDILRIAEPTSKLLPNLFSMEMWGGVTLMWPIVPVNEDPVSFSKYEKKAPNTLFQMLLSASNAVGYKNYPDNVIRVLLKNQLNQGIDVYRI